MTKQAKAKNQLKLKKPVCNEQGIAMLAVLGIMMILTVLAFGAIAVSQNDLTLSERDSESMAALHVSEAGINKLLWQLEQFGNAATPGTYTVPVADGTATVVADRDATKKWYWTITSTGVCGKSSRILKVTVFHFSLWNMNMSLSGKKTLASGGNGIVGNTSIDGPFYIRGSVELSGNSSITGGPLFIKTGSLVMLNKSATLGTSSERVEAYIEPDGNNGDIVNKDGNPILSDPNQNQVYVSTLSNQVPSIDIPTLDPMSEYRVNKAAAESTQTVASPWYFEEDTGFKLGPGQPNGQSEAYKVLDNDLSTTAEGSSRRTYRIDSLVASFGHQDGFAWDKANRRLYVNGTVFVDGDLVIGDSANSEINYYGRGTLVVNGDITVNGKLRPPADTGYGMDAAHVLGLVTDNAININISGGNQPDRDNPDICGAFFATQKVKMIQNNTTFVGSMIAGTLDFASGTNNSHLFTNDHLPDFLPPSLPGSTRFLAMTASWREVE